MTDDLYYIYTDGNTGVPPTIFHAGCGGASNFARHANERYNGWRKGQAERDLGPVGFPRPSSFHSRASGINIRQQPSETACEFIFLSLSLSLRLFLVLSSYDIRAEFNAYALPYLRSLLLSVNL